MGNPITIDDVLKKYDDTVDKNLTNMFDDKKAYKKECNKNYDDPDDYSSFIEKVKTKILFRKPITMSIITKSDGLLSKTFFLNNTDKSDMENNSDKYLYHLFRYKMGNCLRWPAHHGSINQARGSAKDRLDRVMIKIHDFYRIVQENENKETSLVLKEIMETNWYPFFDLHTLVWLSQYESFKDFIEKRKLQEFIEISEDKKEYDAIEWTNYYKELYKRTELYKINNKIDFPPPTF